MADRIGVGIIGTGIGLRQVAPGFIRTGLADIVAVSGSSVERARQLSSEYNIPLTTGDYREVCESDDVDIICVTTPNEFHLEHMAAALVTDKHVFLEKPVANDAVQTKEIADMVGNKDRLVVVGHQLRFNPYFGAMRDIIQSGAIGRVYYMTISHCSSVLADPSMPWKWSFDVNKGGGMRLAMGVHLIDAARYLLAQEPVAVVGSLDPVYKTRTPKGEAERECFASMFFSATVSFPDATVEMSTTPIAKTEQKFDVVVRGEKGDLTFDLDKKLLRFYDGGRVEKVLGDDIDTYYDSLKGPSIFWDSFTYYAQEIVDAISSGSTTIPLASTADDAIINMEVLDAALVSYQKGTRELLGPWNAGKYI